MSVDICHVYVESFANDHGKVWPNHRHCRRLPEILPLIENMIIMLCYFCLLQVGDKISRKQQDKMKSFHLVQQVFSKSEIVRMTVSSNQELFISKLLIMFVKAKYSYFRLCQKAKLPADKSILL